MMKKRIIPFLLAAAMVMTSACASRIASELRAGTAAYTDNVTVDGAMMSYYFNDVYNTFLDYYGSNIKYFGIDTEKPLADQMKDEEKSWYEYFMDSTKLVVEDLLLFNEAAAASGISLSEAEKEAILNRVEGMDTALYGDGVTRKDIYNAKLIEALAYKYQYTKKAEFVLDDSIFEAVREDDTNEYKYVDYCSFDIYYSKDGENSTEAFTEKRVLAYVQELAGSSDRAEFEKNAEKILLAKNPQMSAKTLKSNLSNLDTKGARYLAGDEVSEWAFESSEKAFILSDPSHQRYRVYMRTSDPYYDESRTVNVCHVLLFEEKWGGCDATRAKAEELLEKFTENGGTREALALLALEYSDDDSTCYNGGRYENLAEGSTVKEFNNWCFDSAREPGDADIIESEYGWHLVFFEGEGLPVWQTEVADDISSGEISKHIGEISETYSVTFCDDVIYKIPG